MVSSAKRPASKQRNDRAKKSKPSVESVKADDTTFTQRSDDAGNNDDFEQGVSTFQDAMNDTIIDLRKPDPWAKLLKQNVDAQEVAVLKKLDEIRNKITSNQAQFETRSLRILSKALAPIGQRVGSDTSSDDNEESDKIQVPFTTTKGQRYFDGIATLLSDSYALINCYREENRREIPASRSENLVDTFEKDREAALATIEAARNVTMHEVENALADQHHEVRNGSEMSVEEEQMGRLLLSKAGTTSNNSNQEVSWEALVMETSTALKGLEKVSESA